MNKDYNYLVNLNVVIYNDVSKNNLLVICQELTLVKKVYLNSLAPGDMW